MIPKTENGKTVLVKVGRPLTASNEHELRKKMQNRVSAIEARMRKKRKLEELEERVERLSWRMSDSAMKTLDFPAKVRI